MAVIDKLPRREGGHGQLHAIDNGIQAPFQQFHQVFGSVALPAHRFLIILPELLFADIRVIALQLLLRHQLHAEIGRLLLAALAMLTGAIFALRDRRFRPAPKVHAKAAIDLVFAFSALRHAHTPSRARWPFLLCPKGPCCPGSPRPAGQGGRGPRRPVHIPRKSLPDIPRHGACQTPRPAPSPEA